MIGVGSWVFGFTECIIMDQGGFEDLVHRFAFLFVFFFISPDFSLRTCCVRVWRSFFFFALFQIFLCCPTRYDSPLRSVLFCLLLFLRFRQVSTSREVFIRNWNPTAKLIMKELFLKLIILVIFFSRVKSAVHTYTAYNLDALSHPLLWVISGSRLQHSNWREYQGTVYRIIKQAAYPPIMKSWRKWSNSGEKTKRIHSPSPSVVP